MKGTFEDFLIKNGYLKFCLDTKNMRYTEELKPRTILSSSDHCLDYRYIHESDTNLLNKIKKGLVVGKDISWEDRKNEICFGFREWTKPVTLISPRPKIRVNRNGVAETESLDDSMNIVLAKEHFEKILKAMYDRSVFFEYELKN